MSQAEIERFVADIKTDASLRDEVKGKAADVASLIALATARGYNISAEQVRRHLRSSAHELTDQEIDAAVGGVYGMSGGGGIGGVAGFTKP